MIVHHEGKDYLEIPHGVIDALPPPNLAQHNVVRALVGVLRLRESDETPLPLSQLATLTGLGDSEITRCMKVLEKVAYLHRTYNGSQGSTYRPGLRLRSAYLLGTMLVPLTVLDWSLRELAPVNPAGALGRGAPLQRGTRRHRNPYRAQHPLQRGAVGDSDFALRTRGRASSSPFTTYPKNTSGSPTRLSRPGDRRGDLRDSGGYPAEGSVGPVTPLSGGFGQSMTSRCRLIRTGRRTLSTVRRARLGVAVASQRTAASHSLTRLRS